MNKQIETKYYRLLPDDTIIIDGHTLHRVVATIDRPEYGIKAGDEGGYVESVENIPGNPRIYRDTKIYGTARLRGGDFNGGDFNGGYFEGGIFWGGYFEGGTFRGGYFEGGTFRGGYFEGGTFRGGTFEGGYFRGGDFNGGTFRGGTFWGGYFRGGIFWGGYFDGGTITGINQHVYIGTLKYAITITNDYIKIGCEVHTADEWAGYTDKQILAMDGKQGLEFWRQWKDTILQTAQNLEKPD